MTEQGLHDLLREHAEAHGVPGAAVGVLRDGTEALACYGTADVTTGTPVTAGSRFGVGSLTKSMVATVVARLAANGRLSLDDAVAAQVPELRSERWAERATLRDLLANRSGLPLRVALEFDFAAERAEDDGVLSRLATRVAAEEPTPAAWSYTNAGWCLLGRVIETATGSVDNAYGTAEAVTLDERTFVVDAADPDNPAVTFGSFDAAERPQVLYLMLWGLPRR